MNLCTKCGTDNMNDIDYGTLDNPKCVCKCGYDLISVKNVVCYMRNQRDEKPECERKLKEIGDLVRACANSSYIPKHRVKQILESDGRKLELCEHCMQEYRDESTHLLVCPYWKDKIKNG